MRDEAAPHLPGVSRRVDCDRVPVVCCPGLGGRWFSEIISALFQINGKPRPPSPRRSLPIATIALDHGQNKPRNYPDEVRPDIDHLGRLPGGKAEFCPVVDHRALLLLNAFSRWLATCSWPHRPDAREGVNHLMYLLQDLFSVYYRERKWQAQIKYL
jgi:hypothetical protein